MKHRTVKEIMEIMYMNVYSPFTSLTGKNIKNSYYIALIYMYLICNIFISLKFADIFTVAIMK